MTWWHGSTAELILLAIAGYIAAVALVRLMLGERNRLAGELDQQIAAERQKIAAEKKKAEKDKKKAA
jgi:hypothetical protein